MRQHLVSSVAAGSLVLAMGSVAAAHPGHVGDHFTDGVLHPLLGLDHLLAMIAVGLLAARLGGKGLWGLPVTFVSAMLCGGLLVASGLPQALGVDATGLVEYGIMGSVLVLGLLIAATRVVSLRWGVALVALFAVFHGYAHAAEMSAGSSITAYASGFLLATAALHAAGILGGLALARLAQSRPLRLSGAAICAAGMLMLLGVL